MSAPAWFWPASGSARAVAAVPYAGGFAVADWSAPQIWPFSPSGGVFSPAISLASGYPGLAGLAPDTANGVWALTVNGALYSVNASGEVTLAHAFPPDRLYVGLTRAGASSGVIAVSAPGTFYGYGTNPVTGSFGAPAWFSASNTTTLYSLQPALSGVGSYTYSGGASGLISLPAALVQPTAIAVSGASLAVGGWQVAPTLSGAYAAALNPTLQTMMLAAVAEGALVWQAPGAFTDAWASGQIVTGLADMRSVAWRPDGTQALMGAPSSGAVYILNCVSGVLSLAQEVAVPGASSIVVAGNSATAIVCQAGLGQVATLNFSGGTWATGAAVTGLPGLIAAAPAGPSGAFVAFTSGLALLTARGGPWAIQSIQSVGFPPLALCVDSFGRAYVAGSGIVVQLSLQNVIQATGTWPTTGAGSGIPTAVAVQQGRVIVATPGDGVLRTFGLY